MVQRHTTGKIPEWREDRYEERLEWLGIKKNHDRRVRGDMHIFGEL